MNLKQVEQSPIIVSGFFETESEAHNVVVQLNVQGFRQTGITLISYEQFLDRIEAKLPVSSRGSRENNQVAWLVATYIKNTEASQVEEIFRKANAINLDRYSQHL